MSEPRIFWPIKKDIYRPLGLADLIESSLKEDERGPALRQLLYYDYEKKDDQYSPKVLAVDVGNAFDDDTRIIGYILYRKTWIRPNTFETAQTLVHSDYRRLGLASKLREAVWADIRSRGGDYCISATLDPTHMKTAKQIDHLEDGWIIVGRRLNSV